MKKALMIIAICSVLGLLWLSQQGNTQFVASSSTRSATCNDTVDQAEDTLRFGYSMANDSVDGAWLETWVIIEPNANTNSFLIHWLYDGSVVRSWMGQGNRNRPLPESCRYDWSRATVLVARPSIAESSRPLAGHGSACGYRRRILSLRGACVGRCCAQHSVVSMSVCCCRYTLITRE